MMDDGGDYDDDDDDDMLIKMTICKYAKRFGRFIKVLLILLTMFIY